MSLCLSTTTILILLILFTKTFASVVNRIVPTLFLSLFSCRLPFIKFCSEALTSSEPTWAALALLRCHTQCISTRIMVSFVSNSYNVMNKRYKDTEREGEWKMEGECGRERSKNGSELLPPNVDPKTRSPIFSSLDGSFLPFNSIRTQSTASFALFFTCIILALNCLSLSLSLYLSLFDH